MPRRILEGTVVSDKQDKTVVVRVVRRVKDKLYGKFIMKSAKFSAHDENNTCKEGDVIRIEECRPISKNKSWRVLLEGEKPTEKKEPAKKAAAKKPAAKKEDKKADEKKVAPKKAAAKKPAAKKTTKKDDK